MRLFLFPVAKGRSLIYCQRINQQLTTQQTYAEKITVRAGAKWIEWEKAERGWQKKVTGWGNNAFAKIPYEEWGLKTVPPLTTRRKTKELAGKEEVEVLFDPTLTPPATILEGLEKMATERQAFHKKWMVYSIVAMPLSLPFGLIPVIPNLPFFYLVFRAWSHWRALSGSKHVEFLINNGLAKPVVSSVLQKVYDIGRLHAHRAELEGLVYEHMKHDDNIAEVDQKLEAQFPDRVEDLDRKSDRTYKIIEKQMQRIQASAAEQTRALITPVIEQLESKRKIEQADLKKLEQEVDPQAQQAKASKAIEELDAVISCGKSLLNYASRDYSREDARLRSKVESQMYLSDDCAKIMAFCLELPKLEAELVRAIDQIRSQPRRQSDEETISKHMHEFKDVVKNESRNTR